MHLLNSLGSILARCYFRGAHMPHATNNVRILPGTHLYTWVESSNVDKVSCWRTKSARHWWESNPEPFDPESRVQSNIPRHLHNLCVVGKSPGLLLDYEFCDLWAGRTCSLNCRENSAVMTYLAKINISLWLYLTKLDGIFGKMQIISYSCKILKHI